jgi:hypothetical protein
MNSQTAQWIAISMKAVSFTGSQSVFGATMFCSLSGQKNSGIPKPPSLNPTRVESISIQAAIGE